MPAMAVTAANLLGIWPAALAATRPRKKGRAFLPAPILTKNRLLGLQDRDDLVGVRIHDHDLLLDEDELETTPFRIDRYNSLRQRMEGHVARYAGADRKRYVHVRRLNALLLDHAGDLGALIARELRGRAGLASRGRALAGTRGALTLDVHAVLLALGLLVTVLRHALIALGRALITMLSRALITLGRALAGRLSARPALLFGLHAAAVLLTLGLHVLVLPAFAAFSLHVFAALHLVFGALALFSAHRLLLGLCGLHAMFAALGFRRAIAIHRCRRRWCAAISRRRALLGRGTRRRCLAAHSGSLRVGETGPGDQRRRGGRDQKAISHGIAPHVFALPTPTTKGEVRCSSISAVPSTLFVNAG